MHLQFLCEPQNAQSRLISNSVRASWDLRILFCLHIKFQSLFWFQIYCVRVSWRRFFYLPLSGSLGAILFRCLKRSFLFFPISPSLLTNWILLHKKYFAVFMVGHYKFCPSFVSVMFCFKGANLFLNSPRRWLIISALRFYITVYLTVLPVFLCFHGEI